jgi:hypothetical protein
MLLLGKLKDSNVDDAMSFVFRPLSIDNAKIGVAPFSIMLVSASGYIMWHHDDCGLRLHF